MKRLLRVLLVIVLVVAVLLIVPYFIPLDDDGIPPEQLADPQGEFITVGDYELYVRQTLPPDGTDGSPALLMVHGLFGNVESWRYNREALAEAGYRVIAYDRLGAGLSDKPWEGDYSASGHAEMALELLNTLDVETVTLVGHSAGANVVAAFALNYPEHTDGLVIVAGAIGTPNAPAFVGDLLRLPPLRQWGRVGVRAFLTRDRVENAIAGFQADPSFLTESDYDAYWRTFQTPAWDTGFLAQTRDLAAAQVDPQRLSTVEVPILLLHGTADQTVAPSNSETLDALLPDATLIVYEDVGHQPMEEAAAQFNTTLIDWLDANVR